MHLKNNFLKLPNRKKAVLLVVFVLLSCKPASDTGLKGTGGPGPYAEGLAIGFVKFSASDNLAGCSGSGVQIGIYKEAAYGGSPLRNHSVCFQNPDLSERVVVDIADFSDGNRRTYELTPKEVASSSAHAEHRVFDICKAGASFVNSVVAHLANNGGKAKLCELPSDAYAKVESLNLNFNKGTHEQRSKNIVLQQVGLDWLQEFTNLRQLQISSARLKSVEMIPTLDRLEVLVLRHVILPDGFRNNLDFLKGMKNLKKLVYRPLLLQEDLVDISALSQIETLIHLELQVPARDYAPVASLPNLTRIAQYDFFTAKGHQGILDRSPPFVYNFTILNQGPVDWVEGVQL